MLEELAEIESGELLRAGDEVFGDDEAVTMA